jgi:hypothetical protein
LGYHNPKTQKAQPSLIELPSFLLQYIAAIFSLNTVTRYAEKAKRAPSGEAMDGKGTRYKRVLAEVI